MVHEKTVELARVLHAMPDPELRDFVAIIETLQEPNPCLTFRERLKIWAGKMVEFSDALKKPGVR